MEGHRTNLSCLRGSTADRHPQVCCSDMTCRPMKCGYLTTAALVWLAGLGTAMQAAAGIWRWVTFATRQRSRHPWPAKACHCVTDPETNLPAAALRSLTCPTSIRPMETSRAPRNTSHSTNVTSYEKINRNFLEENPSKRSRLEDVPHFLRLHFWRLQQSVHQFFSLVTEHRINFHAGFSCLLQKLLIFQDSDKTCP